ncbi:MAG: hypothetical protein AAF429_12755 [Pseudomonadota bacterium]
MTTVVTRLYSSQSKAKATMSALRAEGFPADIMGSFSKADGKGAALVSKITDMRVPDEAAATYAKEIAKDGHLVVIHAPFTPFGAARRAMAIADANDPKAVNLESGDFYIEERSSVPPRSILRNHPRFFTADYEKRGLANRKRASSLFGMRMLKDGLFFPMPIYKNHRYWSVGRLARHGTWFPFPIYKNHRYWTLPPRVV